MLTETHKRYIENCVLSWLASSNKNNEPNVSPKEIFTHFGENIILVANIASPNTVKNIQHNENVCISMVDIFIQKGFQFKGKAKIVSSKDQEWEQLSPLLKTLAGEKFPFKSFIKITVHKSKQILAPSYIFYPETSEVEQIANAKKTYKLE